MVPGNHVGNSDSDRLERFFGAYEWRFDNYNKGSRYCFESEDTAKYCYSYLFMLGVPVTITKFAGENAWCVTTPHESNEPQVSALLLIVEEQKENERREANGYG